MKKLNLDPKGTTYRTPSSGGETVASTKKKTRTELGASTVDKSQGRGQKIERGSNPTHDAQKKVSRSRSGFGAILGGLGGRRLRGLGAGTALFFGALVIPGVAMADYVRLDQGAPQIVTSEVRPNVTASTPAAEDAFDPGRLESYPLFSMFWFSNLPGTSQEGVWSLSPEGVGHLLEYARTHNLDGERRPTPSERAGPIDVTEGHRALVAHLLQDSYYSAFISQDAVPLLRAAFDLPEVAVGEQPRHRPVDAGEVRVCSPEEWWGSQGIGSWSIQNLPSAMATEYDLGVRAGRYERAATLDDKKYELTCLLHQFGKSLNAHDDLTLPPQDQVKHRVQEELLDRFFALPVFDVSRFGDDARQLRAYFATDFNGSGMGLAQTIAKGFDPNLFPTEFPHASGRSSPVSLSMSTGNLRQAMEVLDQIRVADGLDAAALELKSLPSMNYMVGEPSGHDKINFDERNPPIDRMNYGKMIQAGTIAGGFANDPRLTELKPVQGFTFPIDAITATGQAVEADARTKLEIHRASDNARLNVEVKIHEEDGNPARWSLVFTDSSGAEVAPSDVIGLLKRNGRTLGDGLANQTLETGYWGRCDDNTGANAIMGRFPDLPDAFTGQIDGNDNVYIRVGDTLFPVPKQRALELVYMDLPGIGNTENPVDGGYRFGYDASEISWSRGTTDYRNFGVIEGFTPSPFTQTNHRFIQGDQLRIHNTQSEPILGTLRIETNGSTRYIEAKDVRSIVRLADGQVRVAYQSGSYSTTATGKPLTDLSHLDWSQAPLGTDPSDETPGREHTVTNAGAGATLATLFEELDLAATGITASELLRANPDITTRPAATVAPAERVKIPELTISITPDSPTAAALFEKYAVDALPSRTIRDANDDALRAIVVPVLEVGQTVQLTVGDARVEHTVADGDTWASILAQHATADVPAEQIDEATRRTNGSLFTTWDKVVVPPGTTIDLVLPAHERLVSGPPAQTLAQYFAAEGLDTLGHTLAAITAANPHVAARPAGWVADRDEIIIPERGFTFSAKEPFSGDFFMRRSDGVDITVRAGEVKYVQGETPHDMRFTHYLSFVQRSEGVWGNEGSLTRSISNGRKWIDHTAPYVTRGADRPDWAGDGPLLGINGPLHRQPGDKMVFWAGTASGTSSSQTVFVGWYQVDESTGRIKNEGFIKGEPDFVWGIHEANLNWNAPSTYIGNAMLSKYRIAMLVNGTPELRAQNEESDRIAERLGLPSDWRSYVVTTEEVRAHLDAQAPSEPTAEN